MKHERADILLLNGGLAESREEAKKLIMAGKVRLGSDRLVNKASESFPVDSVLSVDKHDEFVSRGAYKLLPAIEKYPPTKSQFIAADIGASTGGFCDVLLRKGAKKIYAVDAGVGQLHQKMRARSEIICLEKTNARYISDKNIPDKLDLLTMDVSFISVRKILPAIVPLLAEKAMIYILVKPQFETERKNVEKGGVVRDPIIIEQCVRDVANFATRELGWKFLETIPSPITGPKGNHEQVLIFEKN